MKIRSFLAGLILVTFAVAAGAQATEFALIVAVLTITAVMTSFFSPEA